MGNKELNQVLSTVRKLTPTERRQVVQAIRQQDGVEVPASGYARHSEDWLLPGLEHELKRRGLLLVSLSLEKLSRWAPNYTKDSIEIRTVLKAKLKQPNHAELLALGRVCANTLAHYLLSTRPEGITLGPKMLLTSLGDIPVALNQAFPGYLAGGALSALIRTQR